MLELVCLVVNKVIKKYRILLNFYRKKEVMDTSHKWRFFRSGGFDQVYLETEVDLKSLSNLNPKLWTALGCPTSNLEFESKTPKFLDTDEDSHIRVPEVVAAVN